MTQVDIIILSNCINSEIYQMNLNCLDSLFRSETEFNFNVLLFESNKNFNELEMSYSTFPKVKVIIPDEPFHFNKYLNKGITLTQN